jgi:hypothetical protein
MILECAVPFPDPEEHCFLLALVEISRIMSRNTIYSYITDGGTYHLIWKSAIYLHEELSHLSSHLYYDFGVSLGSAWEDSELGPQKALFFIRKNLPII